jgi:thiol-disulfide isomerase/thioredoxin
MRSCDRPSPRRRQLPREKRRDPTARRPVVHRSRRFGCRTGADGGAPDLVKLVRQAIADKDFARGEQLIAEARKAQGTTSQVLAAQSWLGRGALAEKRLDAAERYAEATYKEASPLVAKAPMDRNPNAPLPIAIGAAIEVLAHVRVERGERSEAVAFLRREVARFKGASVETRIQKNLNLFSLEGTVAPPLELREYLGAAPPPLTSFKGKVVVLFFWAHWCGDCKQQGPILAALAAQYGKDGLAIVAPTQRYGYVAGGKEAPPDVELRYIDEVRQKFYPELAGQPIPVSEANHIRYGVSTTPTLVLLDRAGRVRLYNPGKMTREALEPLIKRLLADSTRTDAR